MHEAVFPSQVSSWLSYSLYPPISLHHLSSFFKSTQYFLNSQVLTGWEKKKKRNYEESAYEPLENWLMFPTPLSSLKLPPFHSGPPSTSSQPWICSDMPAWGRKSSKQEGRWIAMLGERSTEHWDLQQKHLHPYPTPYQPSISAPSNARTFSKGQGQESSSAEDTQHMAPPLPATPFKPTSVSAAKTGL